MTTSVPVEKMFTFDEAVRTLPLVKAIVEDIVKLFKDVQDRQRRLVEVREFHGRKDRPQNDPYEEELRQMETDVESDIERLKSYISELNELGVEFKDPRIGLVDFRAMLDDREVYLCWRLGEETISHWHELDAGFNGRQPLAQLSTVN